MPPLLASLILALFTASGFAGSVQLQWDPNSESDLAGYRVYSTPGGGGPATVTDVGLVTMVTVPDLAPGQIYRFTVTAYNPSGLESDPSNEVTYSVPVNDPPVAAPAAVTVPEDTSLAIALVGTDPDGAPLAFAMVQAPLNGTLTGTAPNLTYLPSPNFSGSDSFTFTVSDAVLTSAPATVAITVTPVNDPPVAAPAAVTVPEDTSLAIALVGTDPDGGPLAFAMVQAPLNGTLTGTAPNLTYLPSPNFNGSDSFTFTVSDAVLTSAPATVAITVTPVNDPPVAAAASVTVAEDTSLAIALAGTDPDGGPLAFAIVQAPLNGTLTGTAPNLTYLPNPNFNGSDSFTFTVSDAVLTSAPATVAITVTPVNDPPVAAAASVTVAEDTSLAIALAGTDPDGGPLAFAIVQAPLNGTLTGTAPNLTYLPNPNFNGSDSFTFTVSDAVLTSAPATVAITVTPVNDPPVAAAASVTVAEDTSLAIALAGTDPDGGPLAFAIVQAPLNGTLTGTAPNLTYLPNPNFNGSDSFTFTVSDAVLTSAPATVAITVTPVNDPPVAAGASVTVAEDSSLTIALAGTDPDGGPLDFAIVQAPPNGTLTGTAPNLTYLPNPNFNGSDSFTFTVSDAVLTSAPATVAITVTQVNDPPVAAAASVTVAEDTSLTIALAGTDPDGGPLDFAIVQAPLNGTLTGTAPNLTYLPNPNFNGSDSFTFTVSDAVLTSAPATVAITVTPVNDTPVAAAASVTVAEDTSLAIALAGTDPDGGPLAFAIVQAPLNGTLTGTAPNLTYLPNPNFNGSDSFTFTVSDAVLTSAPATVAITVTPVNDPPVAAGASVTVAEDTSLAIALAGTDPTGGPLAFAIVQAPLNGTLTGTAPNLTYLPNPNFNGSDSFTFTVSDAVLTSAPATVAITVTAVEDPPIARADLVMAVQGGSATTLQDGSPSVLSNDTAGDAGTPAVVLLRPPVHGTVELRNDGTFRFQHDGSLAPEDSFTYVLRGATTESPEAEVKVGIVSLKGIGRIGADVEVEFPVVSGLAYRLEFNPGTPNPGVPWQALASFGADTGGDASIRVRRGAEVVQRFYRVVCVTAAGDLTTPPWGHWSPQQNGSQDLSYPFRGPLARRAEAASASDGSLVLRGIRWLPGEVAPRDGFPTHIVQVVACADRSGIGEWWPIAGHDQTTLTLSSIKQFFSSHPLAGTVLEVIRLRTVADLFGTPSAPDNPFAAGDSLLVEADARSGSWTLTCTADPQGALAYYVTRDTTMTGPFDGTSLSLLPGQTFSYRRAGSSSNRVFVAGRVQTTPIVHYLPSGTPSVASAFPLPFDIRTSGLSESGWSADRDHVINLMQDDLLFLTNDQPSLDQLYLYFHTGSSSGNGWYMEFLDSTFPADLLRLSWGTPFRLSLIPRTEPFCWLEPVPWK